MNSQQVNQFTEEIDKLKEENQALRVIKDQAEELSKLIEKQEGEHKAKVKKEREQAAALLIRY